MPGFLRGSFLVGNSPSEPGLIRMYQTGHVFTKKLFCFDKWVFSDKAWCCQSILYQCW